MTHFSSTSGLLSHPGLSSSGQLPHLKQEFAGKDSGAHLKSKCKIFFLISGFNFISVLSHKCILMIFRLKHIHIFRHEKEGTTHQETSECIYDIHEGHETCCSS